jgi:DNA-binding LacI/PurR family transcriptional regulator
MSTIATRCSVSRSAVSQILSGKGAAFSEDLRRRVEAAATELGYRPNQGAYAVKTGRFQAVAMLLDRSCYLPPRLLASFAAACEHAELHLIVAACSDEQLLDEAPRPLKVLLADGIIINRIAAPPPAVVRRIHALPIPACWINQRLGSRSVHPDDRAAAGTLVDALVARGHTAIAYSQITASRDHYSSQDREAGYRAAMGRHGLAPWILPAVGVVEAGAERVRLARAHLLATPRPSAVVCYSGRAAYAYHLAALSLSIAVPAQLSIVAHLEAHQLDDTGVQLAGVLQPWDELARRTIERATGLDPALEDLAIPYQPFEARDTAAPPSA